MTTESAERPGAGTEANDDVIASEEILEPEIEITDAHHHFYDGDVGSHGQERYVLDDFLSDTASGHNVKSSVFMECGWGWAPGPPGPDPMAPVVAPAANATQVAKVTAAAKESEAREGATIKAIVGFVDLRHGAAAGPALDELCAISEGRFAGIRQSTTWDASPEIKNHRTRPTPGLLREPLFHEGFRELAMRDLTFDAWVYHPQLPDVAYLADAFPETKIVVCHLGGPLAAGPYRGHRDDVLEVWCTNLSELQKRPNVYLKLGGLGFSLMAQREDIVGDASRPATSAELAAYWGDEVRWCIETWGSDRCLFESNFPVDSPMCSYATMWNSYKRMVAEASPEEKRDLFSKTADRFYGISA